MGGLGARFIEIAYKVSDRYRISPLLLSLTMLTSNLHHLLAESSDLPLCPVSLVLHRGHILNGGEGVIMEGKTKHDPFFCSFSLFYETLCQNCVFLC